MFAASEADFRYRLALEHIGRAARLAIVEGQRAYELARWPPRMSLSGYYARRAREGLEAVRAGRSHLVDTVSTCCARQSSVRRNHGIFHRRGPGSGAGSQ